MLLHSFLQPPLTGARVAGGGRSGPTAPPAKGGAHPSGAPMALAQWGGQGRNEVDDPGAQRTGCGLPRRGYRAATPPATLEPKALRRPRPARVSTQGMHTCIPPPGPLKAERNRVSDRNGFADETPHGGSAGAHAEVERGQAGEA